MAATVALVPRGRRFIPPTAASVAAQLLPGGAASAAEEIFGGVVEGGALSMGLLKGSCAQTLFRHHPLLQRSAGSNLLT
jgi:hypothetical protein